MAIFEKIIVLDGQSLPDLAVQQAGSVEALFALAVVNDLSVTDDLTTGILLYQVDIVDKPISSYYKNNRLTPATALTDDDELVAAELEGISYWAINVDFIVQ